MFKIWSMTIRNERKFFNLILIHLKNNLNMTTRNDILFNLII